MKRYLSFVLVALMLVSSPKSVVSAAENVDKVSVSMVGKYDSADTAAIRDIDTVRKRIRFRNHSTGKTYTLTYDNTSMIYDARGTVLSASLLEVGQIVDVTFLKSSRHITTMNVSKDAWVVKDTRDHELVRGDGTAKIKGNLYKIDTRTLVMADGNLALAEDVLATDTVTVSGIGKEIYSVMVTGGHGYVSLSSDVVEDHSLVGAWIELDNEVIHKISPNMLLSAPEGDYNLQILGNGASYQSEVTISRNQETVIDTSNVDIEKPKEGIVTFEVIPENAEVFVDGERVLTGIPQSIRYGFHNLKIMAEDYITQDKYLKIGTPKSVINIELEKSEDAESSSSSSEASSASSSADSASSYFSVFDSTGYASSVASAATVASTISANSSESSKPVNKVIDGYKIYFDKPYDAELYFDGSYVGMIPTNVTKISGSHEIILKKDGYETKSYRISIDSDQVDLTYTFPDLVKIEKEDSSSGGSASSASTGDSSSGSSSASTGDSSSGSSSASTGDSSTGSSSASTGDSSTGSSSASTVDSSTGSSSASTGDTGSNTGATGDAGSTEGTSGTGASSSPAEAVTAGTQASTEATTGDTGASTAASEESAGGNTNDTGTSQAQQASDAASTGSTTNQEESVDAASAASGG